MSLLEPGFLARLERLRVVSKRATSSGAPGDRRSTERGASVEFADHRAYLLGDDPRYIDWNAFARLERLCVKLFHQEEDLTVHLVVDASASMGFGSPTKLNLAKQLAAGLAYAALANLDRAGLLPLGGRGGGALAPARGRGFILRALERLEGLDAEGRPDPAAALKAHFARQRRGLVVVLSDFLDPAYPEALKALLHARHEVWCVQILSPEDRGEGLGGDLELVDSETGARREMTASSAVLSAYRGALDSFCAELSGFCAGRGMGYLRVGSGDRFEDILLSVLRRRRLVA